MNLKFWFFGKGAVSRQQHDKTTQPEQTDVASKPIVATLSEEDRELLKSQHEQVMDKLNEEKQQQMTAAEIVELRKTRMQAMTKVLYGIIVLTLAVPYGIMHDMFNIETLPIAAFLATISITSLSTVLGYILREAECITPLQLNDEIANQTESAYKNVWRWIPCSIVIATALCLGHLYITVNTAKIGTVAVWIIGLGCIWNAIHILFEIFKHKIITNPWYQLCYKTAQTIEIYTFITLFLIKTII